MISLLFSCDNNEDEIIENQCQLISVHAISAYYDYTGLIINSATNSPKIVLQYDDSQSKITSIKGGPILVPTGSNSSEWIFSENREVMISYENNLILYESIIQIPNGSSTNVYEINNNKIISRNVVEYINPYLLGNVEYTYEYSDTYILEKVNNQLRATYFFENGNLTRVEKFIYTTYGNESYLVGKNEILFSQFDDSENLAKGLFFVDGLFYKSFSNNNYGRIDLENYSFINNEFVLDNSSYMSFNNQLNSDGVSIIFEAECN